MAKLFKSEIPLHENPFKSFKANCKCNECKARSLVTQRNEPFQMKCQSGPNGRMMLWSIWDDLTWNIIQSLYLELLRRTIKWCQCGTVLRIGRLHCHISILQTGMVRRRCLVPNNGFKEPIQNWSWEKRVVGERTLFMYSNFVRTWNREPDGWNSFVSSIAFWVRGRCDKVLQRSRD